MEINPAVQKFIGTEEFDKLLEQEDFNNIYDHFYNFTDRGNLTKVFLGCDINPLDYIDSIPAGFLYGTDISSFQIPSHIKSISDAAFYDCSKLTRITIPASVTRIGYSAFLYCNNLTSITFAENSQLTSIGDYAFYGCNMTRITIPASVASIGQSAFYRCKKLNEIYYQGTKEQWFKFFSDTQFVPSNVTSIICIDGTIRPSQISFLKGKL